MADFVKRYTFVPGEAYSAEVNQNFDDITAFLNNSLVHVDGLKAMTGPLALPGTDPTADNQAARKAYVDSQKTAAITAAAAASIPRGNERHGSILATTSGLGDVLVPHGLGVTPTCVLLTERQSGTEDVNWRVAYENVDDTAINVRAFSTITGLAVIGVNVNFFWQVWV